MPKGMTCDRPLPKGKDQEERFEYFGHPPDLELPADDDVDAHFDHIHGLVSMVRVLWHAT